MNPNFYKDYLSIYTNLRSGRSVTQHFETNDEEKMIIEAFAVHDAKSYYSPRVREVLVKEILKRLPNKHSDKENLLPVTINEHKR